MQAVARRESCPVAPDVNSPGENRLDALDLCELRWTPTLEDAPEVGEQSDMGILLGISNSGGLFQTSVCIPPAVVVTVRVAGRSLLGSVQTVTQDEYGYLADIRMLHPEEWFPTYQPAYLLVPQALAA